MEALKRVCSWCGHDLGGAAPKAPTHGVCAACKKRLIPVFLDTLDGPTLLMGDDARAKSANAKARKKVGKDLAAIEGHLLGDVFGCRNARQPGGCGKTPACSTCLIRRTVEDTYANGTEHAAVHAVLRKPTGDVPLTISTRRVKEGVLLKLLPV